MARFVFFSVPLSLYTYSILSQLGPEDVIDYYIDWHKRKIHELETLYQQNLEPIGIISLEEYDKLDDEQFKTLVYDMDID